MRDKFKTPYSPQKTSFYTLMHQHQEVWALHSSKEETMIKKIEGCVKYDKHEPQYDIVQRAPPQSLIPTEDIQCQSSSC